MVENHSQPNALFVCDANDLCVIAVGQGFALFDQHLFAVAGKGGFDAFSVGLFREQRDDRHNYKASDHAEGTGVDRRLEHRRQVGAGKQIDKHKADRENEAAPAARGGGAFPIQAVEEGR